MAHLELDELRDSYKRFAVSLLKYPNKPVDVCVNEAFAFADHIDNDTLKFKRLNIDSEERSQKIRNAAKALLSAELLWEDELANSSVSEKLWKDNSEKAYDIRDEALDILDYFFELTGNSDGLKRVDIIRDGRGHTDMIMDLAAIKEIIIKWSDKLSEKISFTKEQQDEVVTMANMIAPAFGSTTADRQDVNTGRELRDRAFMHLDELLKMNRKAVKIIWRCNIKQQNKYRSDYLWDKYIRNKK